MLRQGMEKVISLKPNAQTDLVACDRTNGFHIVPATTGANLESCVEIAAKIAWDLARASPAESSNAQEAYMKAASYYADTRLAKYLDYSTLKLRLPVPEFYALCRDVALLKGQPLQAIVDAMADQSEADQCMPPESSQSPVQGPEPVRPAWVSKVQGVCRLTGSMMGSLLISTGMGTRKIDHCGLDTRPLALGEIDSTFDLLEAGAPAVEESARMFEALRNDATGRIAAQALPRMEALVQRSSLDEERDLISGIWVPASALVLSLSEPVLRRMFLTPEMVAKLADMRHIVLGSLWNIGSKGGAHPSFRRVTNRGKDASPKDLLPVLRELEVELRRKGPDNAKRLATHFDHAIDVLARNAQRLEYFASLPAAADPQHAGRQLAELIDEFVPVATLTALPRVGYVAQVPADDAGDPATPAEPKAALPDSPPPRAERKREAEAARSVSIHVGVPAKPRAQPGARRANPAEHHHPSEHRGLRKDEVRIRKAKHQLVTAGLLHPFAVLTPKLQDDLLELKREGRLLRNLGSTQVLGGQLIQPPSMTGNRG